MSSYFGVRVLRFSAILVFLGLAGLTSVVSEENENTDDDVPPEEVSSQEEEQKDDDTPEVETESTIDDVEARRGLKFSGDLRPIVTYDDLENRDGSSSSDEDLGARIRLEAIWAITEKFRFGTRLAGTCFVDDCDVDVVLEDTGDAPNGLVRGEFTLDELYLHWFRRERFNIAIGRLQTRFVLRGGVYAKSLDRNDSNNVNVTWTDGFHSTYRAKNGWVSHLVLQRNAEDGTGSIRHFPLNFNDDTARNTYFLGLENIRRSRSVVQRAFDVSYLPDSLLKDGVPSGRRMDYWGVVGRFAMRWPQRSEGVRLRAGLEIGYAPETPTAAGLGLEGSGDVDGLAWDVVASIMDFSPGHSIGVNYGRTGAGWLLSPQFRPNDELFEIRYQWQPQRFPLIEARVRWREELEQRVGVAQKRKEFDFYLRLTWLFTIKDF